MEARARPKPSKPLEGDQRRSTATGSNWRTRSATPVGETDEEVVDSQPSDKRVRWPDRPNPEAEKSKKVELPFKSVKPVDMGVKAHPMFTEANTAANATLAGKNYRIRAPIQREGVTDEMIDQIHNTEVTVKLGDLFGLSRELREGERLKLTKVRQPVAPKGTEAVSWQEEVSPGEEEPLPTEEVIDLPLGHDALDIEELPKVGVFITTQAMANVPAGSIVAQDPYLQYLENLPSGERPKQVYVAKESAPLQVVFPVINQNGSVESVLDSGSQIVSMALQAAKRLGIVWDPGIRIFMESANKTMEESVGLARNVQFRWGTLTVYLQVHIIRNPAYQVLLGRPFDLLTKSQIDNSGDGSQIVTITDPNSGMKCAIPTFDRGSMQRKEDLQHRPDPAMEQTSHPQNAFTNKGFHSSSRN